MPNQNSVFGLQRAARTLFAGVLCVLAILCAAGTARAQSADSSSDDWSSTIFSTYGVTIFLVLLLIGLFVFKKVRAGQGARELDASRPVRRTSRAQDTLVTSGLPRDARSNESLVRSAEAPQPWEKSQPIESEASAYGAYRVDQEVGKLVLGKPHRMDVMASRVADDRRAIEASLVKALDSSDSGEDGRRRAREALEEYGFVARQSALMLLGRDAWERSSAARTLGQIGSQSSLTFLIEALHDGDSVVRSQAVSSLGALKMPAAIGALLDIARRHPDIPASLLSETLSACSVESLGYLDSSSTEPVLGDSAPGAELPELEPFVTFEDLPAGDEDVELTMVLGQLETVDEGGRARIVQQLGTHHAQRSVSALAATALNDLDPAVRSVAVTSLGSIDHASVLGPVLIALADESRIVRAAAARTLTSLHFDRADAYVRVTETADPDTLRRVARACISTGIIAQAVDRLASEDRHQAYEAFSLFTLLARANETDPIIDTIQNHKDDEVRLCAVRVLNVAATPEVAPKLREMIASESMPESVRTAVLEVLYKLDQELPVSETQVTTTL
jgi:HEAT repeat protein